MHDYLDYWFDVVDAANRENTDRSDRVTLFALALFMYKFSTCTIDDKKTLRSKNTRFESSAGAGIAYRNDTCSRHVYIWAFGFFFVFEIYVCIPCLKVSFISLGSHWRK